MEEDLPTHMSMHTTHTHHRDNFQRGKTILFSVVSLLEMVLSKHMLNGQTAFIKLERKKLVFKEFLLQMLSISSFN